MKKIIALMMLCLLLCAMSATAFAATANVMDYYGNDMNISFSGDTYTLPDYPVGFKPPENQVFYGWKVFGISGNEPYFKPDTVIDVKGDIQVIAHYIDKNATYYDVQYKSYRFNEHNTVGYYPATPGELIWIPTPYQYGFGTDAEVIEYFLHWQVDGNVKKFDPTQNPDKPEWGRLFTRALADDFVILNPGDYFYVNGDLTITAIWKDGGGNNDNGGDDDDNGGDTEPSAPKYNVYVKDSENGSVSVSETEVEAGQTVTITATPAEGYGLNELKVTHTGDAAQTVTVTNKSFTMPASDVDVQATFVQRNKVIFKANGGECATASATVNAANKLDELPKATREGYLFIGWFTQAEGGTAIKKETVFDQAETTVYAQWYNAKHTTDPDKNDFKADIDMEDSDILNLLIDEDDKKDKVDIVVYLTVKEENEADVDSDDKTAIVNKAGEDKIAAYLDIELFKKIGDEEPEKISNTAGKIRIKVKLDNDLIPENPVKDSFYIIYYHDGVAKSIPASFDVATKELTFEAYEFSTYSLVYKTQTAEDVNVSLPKTGDDSLPMAFLMLMLVASVGGIVLMAKRRTN